MLLSRQRAMAALGRWRMLNAGFTTPRQIEELLDVPLLTSVNRMDQRDLTVHGKAMPIPLLPTIQPLSRYSESLRALRSGIAMTDVDNPPKVVQLSSTLPGEGKSTVAMSLAVSAAASGLKVLFIDADLRHPSASNFFGLDKEQGLVDLLLGREIAHDVVHYNNEAKLWVLSAGSKTQTPTYLLASDRMKSIVAGMRSSFDFVVIDSPAVRAVVDSVVLAQLADKVVYIVRWDSTPRELIQHTMQEIPGHKKVAGVVFNQVIDKEAKKHRGST
jgi:capsular exopolysaccharide synthesis family protein